MKKEKNEIKILWQKRKNKPTVNEIEELTKKGYDVNIYGAPFGIC